MESSVFIVLVQTQTVKSSEPHRLIVSDTDTGAGSLYVQRSSCLESGTNTVFHRNITYVVVLIEQLLVGLVLLSGDVQQENTRENDQEPHNQADGVLRTGIVVVSEQNERGNQSGCGECDVV
ncbi:hypothetical protein WICPIJ_006912 [Wickerhamomyces pijperi]|uniref:Uncharacterized protein n=1 Tax=Wickerhamomyces pijperi TaxID=599730 RepID=A0A9P8Q3I3_WICPI|nr:hypothetical protein WICPIJ_006912 [Wickerhamomyces pijperi]